MKNGSNFNLNMSEQLRKSRERLSEFRAESQAKARRAVRITNNYAHDHPWRMVMTGVALAFTAGFLMNTKRPRKVVLKQPKPIIKVQAPRSEKKHSPFSAVHALMPLVLMGLKMYQASRPKNKIQAHPVTASVI